MKKNKQLSITISYEEDGSSLLHTKQVGLENMTKEEQLNFLTGINMNLLPRLILDLNAKVSKIMGLPEDLRNELQEETVRSAVAILQEGKCSE